MRRMQHYEIICDCQRHAMRERTLWRRSLRAARAAGAQLRRRGVAIAVRLPIACVALGFPLHARNNPESLKERARVLIFAPSPLSDELRSGRPAPPRTGQWAERQFFTRR